VGVSETDRETDRVGGGGGGGLYDSCCKFTRTYHVLRPDASSCSDVVKIPALISVSEPHPRQWKANTDYK